MEDTQFVSVVKIHTLEICACEFVAILRDLSVLEQEGGSQAECLRGFCSKYIAWFAC